MTELTIGAKFADLIGKKHRLKVPVDVQALASEYARVIYRRLPAGYSGLVLHLKHPTEPAKIIVNSSSPPVRQRFTIAHELGHVIIPWHLGNIAETFSEDYTEAQELAVIEKEADEFAAELLCPTPFVTSILGEEPDLAHSQKRIAMEAEVSGRAAVFRLRDFRDNFVVAESQGDIVTWSLIGNAAQVSRVPPGAIRSELAYASAESHSHRVVRTKRYDWFEFPTSAKLTAKSGDWREILDSLLVEMSEEEATRLRLKISGIVGSANSRAKTVDPERLYAVLLQRFEQRPELRFLTDHEQFRDFLSLRAQSICQRAKDK